MVSSPLWVPSLTKDPIKRAASLVPFWKNVLSSLVRMGSSSAYPSISLDISSRKNDEEIPKGNAPKPLNSPFKTVGLSVRPTPDRREVPYAKTRGITRTFAPRWR
jgi:hypothetical protein